MLENKTKMQHELTQKIGRFINHFKLLSDKLKELFEVLALVLLHLNEKI